MVQILKEDGTKDRKTSAIPSTWESPLFRMKRNMLGSAVLECCGVLRLVKELREVGKIFALFATGMVMIECANHNNGCCRVLK